MKQPNFFIVGAPKCGTTALYTYLRTHPNIFLSRVKEPNFFAPDLQLPVDMMSMKHYLSLFAKAKDHHSIVGEASTIYLLSDTAIENIYSFNKDAKLLVMVRNPIDMLQSFHQQMVYNFNEDIEELESAWNLQELRSRGQSIPKSSWQPKLLQYGQMCKIGEKIERLLNVFPKNQVKVILFDDFIASSSNVYNDVLSFLDLDYDGRTKFPQINEGKYHKFKWLAKLLLAPPAPVRKLLNGFKRITGIQGTGMVAGILRTTKYERDRRPISLEFRDLLIEYFKEDVMLLAGLLGRDLKHWQIANSFSKNNPH